MSTISPKPLRPAGAESRQVGGYPLALVLAALAGAVDAIGFLHWGGLFVSFMSGNSTILGASAAGAGWVQAALSLAVIVAFVGGVALGEVLAAHLGRYAQGGVLALVAALLAAGASAAHASLAVIVAASILSVAMGVQNAAMHRAAGISVALTYVTGTLVQAGRAAAAALLGKGPWSATLPFLGMWCSLVSGSVLGALAAIRSATGALAALAGAALLLAILVTILGRRARRESKENNDAG